MSLSEGEQQLWQAFERTTDAEEFVLEPTRLRIDGPLTSKADLLVAISDNKAVLDPEVYDRALGFYSDLAMHDDPEEVIARLPRIDDPGGVSFVDLVFPSHPDNRR